MMHLGNPISSVVPGVPGIVLSVLSRSGQPLTGRTVATLTRGAASPAGVAKTLDGLVASGVVISVPAGRANLYSLNREHLAYGAICNLADLRTALFQRIRETALDWSRPAVSVAVFGSTVRGDAEPTSDIDLLVIRPDEIDADDNAWARQVEALSTSVLRWTGNDCDVLEYTTQELNQLADVGDSLIVGLRRDTFTVFGADVRELLTGTR